MHLGKVVLLIASICAVGFVTTGNGQAPVAADEELLKSAGIPTDNGGLFQFLRHGSFNDGLGKSTPEVVVAAARLLAVRRVPGAIEVLFNSLPQVGNDWALEEILTSLGMLTVQGGTIDPLLREALQDKPAARRAAAVYILGRRGGLDQRETVRTFLGDPDELIRLRASQGLVGKRPALRYQDLAPADESLLHNHGLSTGETALLDVLRKRTLQEDDQKRLRQLIADLGAPWFADRSRATKLLIKEGTPALAFLKPVLRDSDPEVARRAGLCIEEIRRGPGPALPTAAVRLLARPPPEPRSPADAIRALLAYAPFADDEAVEEEICTALMLLSTRELKIHPLLSEALRDPLPARRAVAAYVLGRVGTREHVVRLIKLVDDPVPAVRLRAVQGMLFAGERSAVPQLIALLSDVPAATLWQVEEMLHRLAGPVASMDSAENGTPEKRQLAIKAWDKWFALHGSTLDLGRLAKEETHLGLLTVCEYDSAIRQSGGQVWEADHDGKLRWKISGVPGPMDAQVLPNGRVLIAENLASRVTERDLSGTIKWEHRTPGNPIACQRLPNGNTFIATYNQVMEITPDHRQAYLLTKGAQYYVFSARKTHDGQVVAMSAQGNIFRFDPLTGKDYPSINLGPNGGWCSVEALGNGRYLVATMNNGQVREIDAEGKAHWTIIMPGAFRATRLPSGNTLVASMTTRLIAEFDRIGNKCWEKTCEGRPWSIRYR